MYMDKGPEGPIRAPPMMTVAIVFALVMTFVLGLWFDSVLELCMRAAEAFPGLPPGN
jgi:NADH:ubiquinone oxidoreductase subunit 2 (subunit N)